MSETTTNQRLSAIFEELKRLRMVYSQSDFARQLGLSKATVNQMLLGQASITRRTVDKLCEVFPTVSNVWLLTGVGNMFSDAQTQQAQQPLASVQISNVGNSTTNVASEADSAQEIAALKAENARLKEEIDWLRSLINPKQ